MPPPVAVRLLVAYEAVILLALAALSETVNVRLLVPELPSTTEALAIDITDTSLKARIDVLPLSSPAEVC